MTQLYCEPCDTIQDFDYKLDCQHCGSKFDAQHLTDVIKNLLDHDEGPIVGDGWANIYTLEALRVIGEVPF